MNTGAKNILNYSLIGIAAYIFADVIHEVIGHSGSCILLGYKIKLLSSVYFKSNPAGILVSICGPLANLLFAIFIYIVLKKKTKLSLTLRFFLLLTFSYNLFWFSGTIIQSGFSNNGDWTYLVKKSKLAAIKTPVLIFAGITAYYFSMKIVRSHFAEFSRYFRNFPLKGSIYYSYFAATIAAVIAGLFFAPSRIHAAVEGLLEMLGSIPILFIKFGNSPEAREFEQKSGNTFNAIIVILFILFCLTLGRGFVF